MKITTTLVAILLTAQIWAQTVSVKTQAVYDKLTKTENRYDVKPQNNGSLITEIYYVVKAGTMTIYEAALNEDKSLNWVKETAIPLAQIKSVKAKELIIEGGGEPDFETTIALKPGKKVTEKLYGDADTPVKTMKTKVVVYFSEMDIARSFAGTVKNNAKIK